MLLYIVVAICVTAATLALLGRAHSNARAARVKDAEQRMASLTEQHVAAAAELRAATACARSSLEASAEVQDALDALPSDHARALETEADIDTVSLYDSLLTHTDNAVSNAEYKNVGRDDSLLLGRHGDY